MARLFDKIKKFLFLHFLRKQRRCLQQQKANPWK